MCVCLFVCLFGEQVTLKKAIPQVGHFGQEVVYCVPGQGGAKLVRSLQTT